MLSSLRQHDSHCPNNKGHIKQKHHFCIDGILKVVSEQCPVSISVTILNSLLGIERKNMHALLFGV